MKKSDDAASASESPNELAPPLAEQAPPLPYTADPSKFIDRVSRLNAGELPNAAAALAILQPGVAAPASINDAKARLKGIFHIARTDSERNAVAAALKDPDEEVGRAAPQRRFLYTITTPHPFNGQRFGIQFENGVAVTDEQEIAIAARSIGYRVELSEITSPGH